MGIVTYFKVTPRKDRIASSVVYTLASFPSFLPLTPLNTPVFPRRFEQSDEKAHCESAQQFFTFRQYSPIILHQSLIKLQT